MNLLQLMFDAFVAAVESRPLLHQCVVIFSGPVNNGLYVDSVLK